MVALGGRRLGEEGTGLFRRRQNTDRVEECAADELGVGAAVGGRQVQLAQFFHDALIDEIARLEGGERVRCDRLFVRRRDRRDREPAEIPRGDRAFTMADDFHHTVVVHRRDGGVAGGVFGPARHVLMVPVVEEGSDLEGLRLVRLEHDVRRRNFDPLDARILRRRRRRVIHSARIDSASPASARRQCRMAKSL